MKTRFALVYLLVVALMAPSVWAQEPSEGWHAYAARLAPQTLVVVTLAGGTRVQGTLLGGVDDAIRVQPKMWRD